MKHIKAGNRVFIGSACGEPQAPVRALVESGENAEDTELLNVLTRGVAPYTAVRSVGGSHQPKPDPRGR